MFPVVAFAKVRQTGPCGPLTQRAGQQSESHNHASSGLFQQRSPSNCWAFILPGVNFSPILLVTFARAGRLLGSCRECCLLMRIWTASGENTAGIASGQARAGSPIDRGGSGRRSAATSSELLHETLHHNEAPSCDCQEEHRKSAGLGIKRHTSVCHLMICSAPTLPGAPSQWLPLTYGSDLSVLYEFREFAKAGNSLAVQNEL